MVRFGGLSYCRGLLVVLAVGGSSLATVGQSRGPVSDKSSSAGKAAPAVRRIGAADAHSYSFRVQVLSRPDFDAWAQHALPGLTVSSSSADRTLVNISGITGAQLPGLLACPWVKFVDGPNRAAHEERQIVGHNLATNRVTALHRQLPNLAGQGMAVSIKENPFDPADLDLRGRVLNAGAIPGPAAIHATTMATIVAGAGNTEPTGRGVAWQAQVATSDFAQLLPDDSQQLLQAGITVQNHSYGVGIENFYGLESRAYDQQTRRFPALLHVFSSGNVGAQASPDGLYQGLAGVANLTGQFKMSKNTLSVGATDAVGAVVPPSSRGPAYDGRLKPELVAYGDGGTSDAAALVSGISTLVQQAYREPRGGALPPAALVKAALINSADDIGRPGPDFIAGFGQADALGAVQAIRANRFFTGEALPQGERVFPITVPAGTYLLKATLVWHDTEAAAGATQALVNDLDLEVVNSATGQRWRPWVLSSFPHPDSLARPARRRADHLNNVEQVTLTAPVAGTYELRVRGENLPAGAQPFSLVYELESGFSWVEPVGGVTFRPREARVLRWQWRGPATPARLEYQAAGSPAWSLLKADVDLTQEYYVWATPDTLTLARVRLVAGSTSYPSETFALAPPVLAQIGYVCPDQTAPTEALLSWNALPGVARYQVYELRGQYLTALLQTADTALVLTRPQLSVRYYAVAPLLDGLLLDPGRTVDYTESGIGCYVRSFLPREIAAATVQLDLTLGSLYKLKSATLEKETPAGYQPVQTVRPVTELQITFVDANPRPGRNTYRVRLIDINGASFYSQSESVQYVAADDLQLYPNPVAAGAPLQVIQGEGGPLRMQLYDAVGQLVREATEEGQVKQFDTRTLRKGLYILRIRTVGGRQLSRRVVIL